MKESLLRLVVSIGVLALLYVGPRWLVTNGFVGFGSVLLFVAGYTFSQIEDNFITKLWRN
jgi:hypothetical protein